MVDSANASIFPTSNPSAPTQNLSANSTNSESRNQLTENFDTFLQLLVTQIQNQDPTSPTDTETFTQQLVQFSELEQSIQSNDNLETILKSIESQSAANVVSYLGATVTANGATATLSNGRADFNLQAQEFIPNAEISIRNGAGEVVFQGTQTLQAGQNTFSWNGRGLNGQQFNDGGSYTITARGVNASGAFSSISSAISGVVDGVEFNNGTPQLRIGDTRIPVSTVTSVNQTP